MDALVWLRKQLETDGNDLLTPLTEIPQGCSSKFLTLGRV